MQSTYRFTIQNQSHSQQSYTFYSSPPRVSFGPTIYPTVLYVASVPEGSQATLEFSSEYTAVCGASQGSLSAGSVVNVFKTVPVSLGADGTVLDFSIDEGRPDLKRAASGGGPRGGFTINTGREFSSGDVDASKAFNPYLYGTY